MHIRKKTAASATALLLAGGALLVGPTAAHAADHPSGVAVNEINSQGDDFIELINTGDTAVDLSDWTFTDDNTDRSDDRGRFEPGTTIEPGAVMLLWGEGHAEEAFAFGLGGGDEVNLFDGAGEVVDAHAYGDHAGDGNTWGRIPDGAGAFVLTASTPGELNHPADIETVESPIVINEIESNGDPVDDWVELANTDTENSIDLSGWSIIDGDPTHEPLVFPEGTEIESGGYWSIYTDAEQGDAGFGLGGNDSVTLFNADGDVVDQTSWEGHSVTTWGRIPDMTGEFAVTGEPTREMPNVEAGEAEPVNSTPWPWALDEIVAADAPGTFDGDISGVDFDEQGNAYAVHNGTGELFVLEFADGGTDAQVTASYQLRYADGSGIPDAEGVTVGEGGAVFVATERNNADNGTSRPSVLRFELPADPSIGELELSATTEWNLVDSVGTLGANSGLEAVEWLPNAFGGVYAVGVEGTGEVLFVSLAADGSHELVNRYASPFQGVMALDYQEQFGELLVTCDEVCEGRSVLLTIDGDEIAESSNDSGVLLIDRPELLPNVANEGFASHITVEACPADAQGQQQDGFVQTVRQLWGDDNATDSVSLRTGISVITECAPATGDDDNGTGDDGTGDDGTGDDNADDGSVDSIGGNELPETAGAPALWMLAAGMMLAAAGLLTLRARKV